MASFAEQHAEWQRLAAVAKETGSPAIHTEAERLRQQLVASPAVQIARKATNAKPVRT